MSFAGVVLIAGANPIAVRFSNAELDPLWGAGLRFGAASILLFLIVLMKRLPLPRHRALLGSVLFGILSSFGAYAFVYIALKHIQASTASPIMASVPLLTFFLAIAHGVERFRWRGLLGGALSVAGIAVLSGVGSDNDGALKYILMVVAGAACAAESGIVIKKFPQTHTIALNAVAMAVGSVLLLASSFAASERHVTPDRAKTWFSVVFLILLGSMVLFLLYVTVVTRWTVTGASYQFVLFPIISVILASLVAGEELTPGLGIGVVLVLGGVYIGALSGHSHRRQRQILPPAECPPSC